MLEVSLAKCNHESKKLEAESNEWERKYNLEHTEC